MNKVQRSWNYNGRIIYEDQVRICKADDYMRDELLAPVEELYGMMSEQGGELREPMGVAGRIGAALTNVSQDRICQVFHTLKLKLIIIDVVIATEDTPGVPSGMIIDVEVNPIEEVKP